MHTGYWESVPDRHCDADTANQFKIIGYYICEVIDMPGYLKGLGERMLSVSSCLGEMHPKLDCYFVDGWSKGEKQAYQKRMKLNHAQLADYAETVGSLFGSRSLDSDGRFLRLWDAVNFYKNSFLCNSLRKQLPEAVFNELVLAVNGVNSNSSEAYLLKSIACFR